MSQHARGQTRGNPSPVDLIRLLYIDQRGSTTAFDHLVALTAKLLAAPWAALVLVEDERSWTLASTTPCGDLDRSAVVSIPVRTVGGERIAAIEVSWSHPRELAPSERLQLEHIALIAQDLMDLHAVSAEHARSFDLMPVPMIIIDIDGVIEQANTATRHLLGKQSEELVGRGFLELVVRRDRVRATAELARVLFTEGRTGQLRADLIGLDGDVPCEVSLGHLQGVRRHLQVILHDLSSQQKAEEDRSRLSEQLARAQRLDSVGQVAGSLAHDLNNLLSVMLANVYMAKDSLREAQRSVDSERLEALQEELAELEFAVDRSSRLTGSLLQFARQREGTRKVADVGRVMESLRALIGRSQSDHVRLDIEDPGPMLEVAADPDQLERVLVNLVLNARQAIDVRGSISVQAEPSADRSTVDIEVVDDGCGMDEFVRARAFEPLFTTRPDAGGSGLGLASVASFIDGVGGSITLDSELGRGTRITLRLPRAEAQQPVQAMSTERPVAGARILLVDPGKRTQVAIEDMLVTAGYRVLGVSTGQAALEVLAASAIDLLITELSLPDMPGERLIAAVDASFPGVRCLVSTSVAVPGKLDGKPLLLKPFSHDRLLRAVRQVLADR